MSLDELCTLCGQELDAEDELAVYQNTVRSKDRKISVLILERDLYRKALEKIAIMCMYNNVDENSPYRIAREALK